MSDAVVVSTPVSRALPAWRVRVWHAYLVLGVAAIAGYYRLPKAGWGQCVLLTALTATAAAAPGVAAWRSRGWQRVVWMSLALALVLTAVANGAYFGYPLVKHRPVPFPSHIDTLLLAAFPLFGSALIGLSRVHRGARRRWSWPVAFVVGAAGCALLWQQTVMPTWDVPLPDFARKVSTAYPVLDVVIFAMLVVFVARARGRSASTCWLVASYAVMIAGAVEFAAQVDAGTYAYGGITDALWMLSYLLVGVAALHPSATIAPRRTS